jgi:chromosome segregation ATPase
MKLFRYHDDGRVTEEPDRLLTIEAMVAQLLTKGELMSAALDKLTAKVTETTSVMQSAVTLIAGLADQIRQLKDEPVKLEALAAELDTKRAELAAAVSANTPATP